MIIKYGDKSTIEMSFEEYLALQSCGMMDGVVETLSALEASEHDYEGLTSDEGLSVDEVLNMIKNLYKFDDERE